MSIRISKVNTNQVKDAKGKIERTFYSFTVTSIITRARKNGDGHYIDNVKCRMSAGGMSEDKKACESVIGEILKGTIERVDCDPYQWTNKETGEEMELTHRYVYQPESQPVEEA